MYLNILKYAWIYLNILKYTHTHLLEGTKATFHPLPTQGTGAGRGRTSLGKTGEDDDKRIANDDDEEEEDDGVDDDVDDDVQVPGPRPEDDSTWVTQGVRAQQ